MYKNENLLDIHGKNPGDYGRRLLRILYSELELKTSMLPSNVSDRYKKPKLDEERFAILNSKFVFILRIRHTKVRCSGFDQRRSSDRISIRSVSSFDEDPLSHSFAFVGCFFRSLDAMRIKYRINGNHYPEFYKNLVRKKLSDFLLEEERRCCVKAKRDELRRAASTAMTETAGLEELTVDDE